MIKYLFLLFLMIGCSNNDIQLKNKDMSRDEKKQYFILKGANLYSKGKIDEALENYQMVLKLDSKELIALREIGIIFADKGELETAREYLLKALKRNSSDLYTLRNLGYLEFKEQNIEESFKYLEKIKTNQRESQELFIIGYYYYMKENYKKSLEFYQQIIEESFYSNSLFFDSYLKVIESSKKNQRNLLRQLEFYSIDKKENIIKIAKFYSENLKDRKEAIEVLKRFIGNNYVDKEILQLLEKEYRKIKDFNNSDKIKKMLKSKSFSKN